MKCYKDEYKLKNISTFGFVFFAELRCHMTQIKRRCCKKEEHDVDISLMGKDGFMEEI